MSQKIADHTLVTDTQYEHSPAIALGDANMVSATVLLIEASGGTLRIDLEASDDGFNWSTTGASATLTTAPSKGTLSLTALATRYVRFRYQGTSAQRHLFNGVATTKRL